MGVFSISLELFHQYRSDIDVFRGHAYLLKLVIGILLNRIWFWFLKPSSSFVDRVIGFRCVFPFKFSEQMGNYHLSRLPRFSAELPEELTISCAH